MRRSLLGGAALLAARGAEAQVATLGAGAFKVAGTPPTLALDFTVPGTLPPNVTFTRASVGTYFDSTGTMQTATTNTPRWDYNPSTLALRGLLVEDARTNSIANSTMTGAVAGSPGTDPTGWVFSQGSTGLTRQIAGVGVENGIAYIDVRYTGASAASGNMTIQFGANGTSGIPAAAAQQWVLSYYITLSGGTLPPFTGPLFRCNQWDSGGGLLGVLNTPGAAPIVQPLRISRVASNFPVTIANTAFLTPFWLIGMSGSASPVDFTIRVGAPQLELGAFATSFIPTSTVAVARAVDVAGMPNDASFNATTGTWQAEFIPGGGVGVSANIVSGNTGSPVISVGTDNRLAASIRGVATVIAGQGPLFTFGAVNKAAFAYLSGASTGAVNSVAVGPTGATFSVTGTTVRFGADGQNSLAALNGWIRKAAYWPRMLPNWELSRVTT